MSDDLSTSIENLRVTAAKLNELTDTLNAMVKAVEEILREELRIGIPAFVPVDSEDDDKTGATITQYLGYKRVGANFRIVVLWENDYQPETPTVKPWSDCARDVKIGTADKLPQLIKEISTKSEDSIRGVVRVTTIIDGISGSFDQNT